MITDLANLGGSLRGTTDLGGSQTKDIGRHSRAQTGKPDKANSFDQILQNKVSTKPTEKVLKSDQDVRTNYLQKEPATANQNLDDRSKLEPKTENVEVSSSKNEPRTAQENKKSWEEPGSVKEETKSEKVGRKSNSSSSNREQVMLEFMDSMESEFSIPPTRMVEAMTTIPESDQLSSPEDSASRVIAQLNLPTDQEQQALALYVGMLAQLQQTTQEPQRVNSMMAASAASAAVTAPIVMNSQQRRAALNSSLDSMNQKFFVDNKAIQSAKSMQTMNSLTPETSMPKDQFSMGMQAQMPREPSLMQKNGDILRQPVAQDGYGPGKLNLQDLQMQQLDPNSVEAQDLAKSLAALSAAATALDQGLKTDLNNLQALQAEQSLGVSPTPDPAVGASVAAAAGFAGFGLGAGDGEESENEAWGGDASSNSEFMVSQPHSQRTEAAKTNVDSLNQSFGATMVGMEGQEAGASENQANIRQIMNQAQYMIKKGGGETRIQMAPEGIGQVHMKLAVQDGKVNLEMSAETKEAKKLIENSIGDLKSQLGQHNLTVDKVKVDVGNHLANENRNSDAQSQQRQMDMRQEQSKDQARNFWNEFQGGQNRRQAFIDSPGIRAYGSSRNVEPLTPTSPGAAAQKAYSGSGKGRGLNLVA